MLLMTQLAINENMALVAHNEVHSEVALQEGSLWSSIFQFVD
jgi:hypothetical protein